MAESDARIPLPDGGSILAPRHYAPTPHRSFRQSSIVLYRRLHHTLGGYVECDGLINIARREVFSDFETFATQTEDAATTNWLHGNLKPGWTSFESEKFPVVAQSGPLGAERVQQLELNASGVLKPRRIAAWRIAMATEPLLLQVWILEKQGGLEKARALADEIAGAFSLD